MFAGGIVSFASFYAEYALWAILLFFPVLLLVLLFDLLEAYFLERLKKRKHVSFFQPLHEMSALLKSPEPLIQGLTGRIFLLMPLLAVASGFYFFFNLSAVFLSFIPPSGDLVTLFFSLCMMSAFIGVGCFATHSNKGNHSGDHELIQMLALGSYFSLLFCSLGWFFLQHGIMGELFSPKFYLEHSVWVYADGLGVTGLLLFFIAFFLVVAVEGKMGVPYPCVGDYRGACLSWMWLALSMRLTACYALLVLVFFSKAEANTAEIVAFSATALFWGKVFVLRFVGNIFAKMFAWLFSYSRSALSSYFGMLLLSVVGMLLLALDVLKG